LPGVQGRIAPRDERTRRAKLQRSGAFRLAHEPKAADTTKSLAETVSLDPGEFLFREGDAADALYIVKKGVLRIVSGSTVYETVRAGGIVGEMGIVEQGARRSASVIAGTLAELVKIDTAKFLALVANTPDFSLEVMRIMARRLRVMNRRHRHDHD
jgi:CRP/FNR family cyclic AMP-dependent transcriptional regulator